MLKQALMTVGAYWHIFPTYAEAKNAIWHDPNMLFGIIPANLIEKKNESDLRVHLVNGSYIQLIGADNPDRLRGAGPMGMVLDEYDTMKDDVWPILQPILRANGGWAWFIGTPKGKAKLYDLYNLGQSGHKEWKSYLMKASLSGVIPLDELDNAKDTMPTALYNQEFECEFLEGEGSVFRNVRSACTGIPQEPIYGHNYVTGVDLARVQDYTVVSIFDASTNRQVYQDRFQTLEWGFQKKRIISIAKMYNDARVIIDATGLGDPIAEDLARAGVSISPFKISHESKKELIEKLSIWIEQKRVALLPLDDSMLEYDNFTYEMSKTGKVYYNAREGYHDDIVISHALAVSGLIENPRPVNEELTPIRREMLRRLNDDGSDDNEY